MDTLHHINWHKVGAAIAGAMAVFVGWLPEHVQEAGLSFILLFLTDTVSGYMAAGKERRLLSETMRSKMAVKLMQYFCIVVIFHTLGILTRIGWLVSVGIWICSSIEFHSIVENVIRLEAFGIRLGWVKTALRNVSRHFAVQVRGLVEQTLAAPDPDEEGEKTSRTPSAAGTGKDEEIHG